MEDYNLNRCSSPKYYNRETSAPFLGSDRDEGKLIIKEARILSLSEANNKNIHPLHKGPLPKGAKLLAVGASLEDFDVETLKEQKPNVLFISHPKSREPLLQLLEAFPTIEWAHCLWAGIDVIQSEGLASSSVLLTNAKGMFSSILAEYAMTACSYFAKDLPRLLRQKQSKDWNRYKVLELRGATMGIIGYGDIGRASAKLAKAYGMRVVALRRNPNLTESDDPYCDQVYGISGLNGLMSESDYVLVAAPLTSDTKGLVSKETISYAKNNAVLINVGRGAIIDEQAMIDALKGGFLKGAALDVTTVEPLPTDSPLWELDNVLLSPHNMDITETIFLQATNLFVQENLPRFLCGEAVLNVVDKAAGY